jgi:RND family efflux transporter MFP subunit
MNTSVDTRALLRQISRADEAPAIAPAAPRRWPRAAVAAGALVLAGLAAGGWWLHGGRGPAPATPVAPTEAAVPVAAPPVAPGALEASGYVVARREATVSAKVAGRVAAMLVGEGSRVRANQLIARLDDTNARAQVALAQARLEAARSTLRLRRIAHARAATELARRQALLSERFVSAADVERAGSDAEAAQADVATADLNVRVEERNVEAAELAVRDMRVEAPFDGIVTVRLAQVGEMVAPIAGGGLTRTGIATIVDTSALEAEVDVNENHVGRLRSEQAVTLTLGPYPDWTLQARVLAVVPNVDRGKGTVRVRLALLYADARVFPNMSVRARFAAPAPAIDLPVTPGMPHTPRGS